MSKRLLLLLAVLLIGIQSPVWAEPTMDQVYNAARNGQLDEARSMMQEVLRAHPNSAKAHFVDAEVLARSGDLNAARNELAMAEKLQPGLPFANPSAVQELQQELSGRAVPANEAARRGGLSWGWVLVLGGIGLLFVIWMVRRQAQRPVVYTQMPPSGGGYYPPGGVPGGQPMAPMGGGGGSGILGTLATGAALGAGMVAGEALAHRLVDGGGQPASSGDYVDPSMGGGPGVNSDMGGQDFGVSDSGSWGDSSGSWDSSGGDSGSDWT